MNDSAGRLGELVQELLGAQITAKILQETWDSLGPEQRARVAEACTVE
jgi:hypothetical protein